MSGGPDTVLRIIRQRSGSNDDYAIALYALAQARVELREGEMALRGKKPRLRRRK